jgi:hypothetical protein
MKWKKTEIIFVAILGTLQGKSNMEDRKFYENLVKNGADKMLTAKNTKIVEKEKKPLWLLVSSASFNIYAYLDKNAFLESNQVINSCSYIIFLTHKINGSPNSWILELLDHQKNPRPENRARARSSKKPRISETRASSPSGSSSEQL